ncbi:hypothetical protein EIP91_006281 [Steccherinum ochraceum]|uniref:Uncharacterized protein n=1 Tax=Steccherinum ochraceum TaxID=92696 RepID=A0A4R0RBS9_9APHY|nr:hypothetical protein EIP91_006281 [Steccherinum ochraceum]
MRYSTIFAGVISIAAVSIAAAPSGTVEVNDNLIARRSYSSRALRNLEARDEIRSLFLRDLLESIYSRDSTSITQLSDKNLKRDQAFSTRDAIQARGLHEIVLVGQWDSPDGALTTNIAHPALVSQPCTNFLHNIDDLNDFEVIMRYSVIFAGIISSVAAASAAVVRPVEGDNDGLLFRRFYSSHPLRGRETRDEDRSTLVLRNLLESIEARNFASNSSPQPIDRNSKRDQSEVLGTSDGFQTSDPGHDLHEHTRRAPGIATRRGRPPLTVGTNSKSDGDRGLGSQNGGYPSTSGAGAGGAAAPQKPSQPWVPTGHDLDEIDFKPHFTVRSV